MIEKALELNSADPPFGTNFAKYLKSYKVFRHFLQKYQQQIN